jgi:hypothetical protein
MKRLTLVAFVGIAASSQVQAQVQMATCTRDALKAMAANYFKAVETHTVSALPATANVRVTENAAEIKLGEGFFKTGGKALFQRTIIDTGRCSTLTQAVVEEAGKGQVLMAVRLKVEGGRASEVEQIIARTGDFAFKPDGEVATKDQDWETLMPVAQRLTRQHMDAAGDRYYDMMEDPKNDPGFAKPCQRWENGTNTTPNGDCYWRGATMTHPKRRHPVTDIELGATATIHNFRDGWLDVHIFKFDKDGKIAIIHSVDAVETKGTGWAYDK